MLASSLDTGCLGRNSLSLHPMIDRLAVPDIIGLRVVASLRDRLHWAVYRVRLIRIKTSSFLKSFWRKCFNR